MLKQEEERFAETLEHGMRVLEGALASGEKLLDGETVFKLYDTFGFPVDLTADVARERGLSIDEVGFERAMDGQRALGRAASKFGAEYAQDVAIDAKSAFTGYDGCRGTGRVVAIFKSDGKALQSASSLNRGEEGLVVLDAAGKSIELETRGYDHFRT